MASEKKGQYKLCIGDKHLQNSCHFLKALLELAYADLNAQMHDSEPEKVQVKWISDDTLEITGTSLDKKNNTKEGTTLKALFKLLEKSKPNFPEQHIRNSIELLKLIRCDEKERDCSINSTEMHIMQEEDLPTKSQGIRKFKLRLKGKNEGITGNLKYIKEKIEKEYANFEYHIEDKNTSPERNNQNIEKLLCSLDCQTQKNTFQNNIYNQNNGNRRGVFLIQAEKIIQPWFLWRLTKLIGDFENAQIIQIQVDWNVRIEFDNFWQNIAQNIGIKGNVGRKVIIEQLTDYHKTKSVVIVIKRFEDLAGNQVEQLSAFWSELFKSISNISRTNLEKRKLWFVLFLVRSNENNQDTEYPIALELKQIQQKEVENWLNENQDAFLESNYDLDMGYKMLNSLATTPHGLIDDICRDVFKLNNGIADVEHYWKKFA
ncbi:hypothetical protein [uncultured Nostoc sp.]|uniref:hypothetical protein n=1 Tax=uncultured Nostoc sp. TaxID=340711 RepID=UPI0035CA7B19